MKIIVEIDEYADKDLALSMIHSRDMYCCISTIRGYTRAKLDQCEDPKGQAILEDILNKIQSEIDAYNLQFII